MIALATSPEYCAESFQSVKTPGLLLLNCDELVTDIVYGDVDVHELDRWLASSSLLYDDVGARLL